MTTAIGLRQLELETSQYDGDADVRQSAGPFAWRLRDPRPYAGRKRRTGVVERSRSALRLPYA